MKTLLQRSQMKAQSNLKAGWMMSRSTSLTLMLRSLKTGMKIWMENGKRRR
ncbi:hypothetical protein GDO78_006397 [Eleutherodactylus coqui]|uniref:Uncharacterized protein n=1 Tax=Eleutherodactylus coqui TaxID=57060 RepID=A0A8J6KG72_ELECQ|nr:hypothetical protein GDO78_006397 [Eleutherodactylus coqui]